ncbi:hypothetical protein MUO32_10685 [Shinella sp. CPCC 101442]|uniref:hypothetical protein n=1 Tax=Shinella sp. CPCC 101442 TaxID=2932265 RepID=UPI00215332DC|nr:hypothetical protein [Shinella sp. CPCC 101442]MCR6499500.1 hypothetical protein [Shinella sp. CPCC 101442]
MTAPQFVSFLLCIVVYCLVALTTTGSLLTPIGILGLFGSPLGTEGGGYALIFSIALSVLIAFRVIPPSAGSFRWPVFVALCMLLNVFSIGTYADWRRNETIVRFSPDRQMQRSFFWSLRRVFDEPQFEVHAAVLKDCVPYIWSYSHMILFEVEPNTAVNVVPYAWIKECGITRTH